MPTPIAGRSGWTGRSLAALATALLAACATATPPGPGLEIDPTTAPEARATAEFLRGRAFELEGRLADAAVAYENAVRADPESAELHRFLAQVHMRMGNAEKAVEAGERALALEPGDESTLRSMARLYGALQRYDDAIALLRPQFDADTLTSEGVFVLYNLYVENQDEAGAEEIALGIIERLPGDARGPLALGNVLERTSRYDEAELAYRRSLAIDPDHAGVLDAIARLRRRAGNTEGELAALAEKLERHPRDMNALLRMAQIHEQEGDRAAAIRTLEKLVAHHPEQLSAEFQLGFLLYEEKRHEEAVARFENVASTARDAGELRFADEVHYFLGRALRDQQQDDRAVDVLGRIRTDSERFADARILMARILESHERYGEAIVEVKRAAAAVPENTGVRVYLAGLLQRDGDLDGAVEVMTGLIDAHPENADLYYDLGLIYSNAGDEIRAMEVMLKVLDFDGDHPSALNYVGYSWADSGQRLDEAHQMITRAVELRPEDGYIADSLGWVFYQKGLQQVELGNVNEARTSFQEAIRVLESAISLLEEADPVITRHLADAYRSVSRFQDALATYRRALTLEPTPEEALEIGRRIELIELQLKQRSGARRN